LKPLSAGFRKIKGHFPNGRWHLHPDTSNGPSPNQGCAMDKENVLLGRSGLYADRRPRHLGGRRAVDEFITGRWVSVRHAAPDFPP
jgi:hypothetical protein